MWHDLGNIGKKGKNGAGGAEEIGKSACFLVLGGV
jgi:hypothetical protein